MKRLVINFVAIGISVLAVSCNNTSDNKKNNNNNQDSLKTETTNSGQRNKSSTFDIHSIPVSDKELGVFPFFSLPQNLKEQNKPINRKYDILFFPIDRKMTKLEGKVWKSTIVSASGKYDEWSLPYFQKSYEEAIKAVGGVKIFEGKVTKVELDRIKEEARYFGEEGSIDYWNEPVSVYIIRRPNGDDVYVQTSGNNAGGEVQILQKEPFKQTITMLRADQIQKNLNENGKAVLYINFDTDKSTLRPDGKEAVAEIARVLNEDQSLKIDINGYTDNTGDEKHNLDLSKKRAETVKTELIKSGIDESRLTAGGFGQNNPIADNTTEDGKEQNRRVELVKK